MFKERRSFIRFPAEVPLSYAEQGDAVQGQGATHDISAGGIGFFADKEWAPGTQLDIWLKVPDRKDGIYTKGEVVWSRFVAPNSYRTGINLEQVDFVSISHVLKMA